MPSGRATLLLGRLRELIGPRGGDSLSDRELMEHFAARGDVGAFEALLRRHGPMVLGVGRRILRHEADAEDVYQATFLVLARKAASLRWRESVGGWLYGVACRLARRARADAARRQFPPIVLRPMGKNATFSDGIRHCANPGMMSGTFLISP